MTNNNPFLRHMPGGAIAGTTDAAGRIQDVRNFNYFQCQEALEVAGLQKTVIKAIRARMRKVERESEKAPF